MLGLVVLISIATGGAWLFAQQQHSKSQDPGGWGSDHVGQAVPEYLTGDECLFCHRGNVGPLWTTNRHNITMHAADPTSPGLVELKKVIAEAMTAEVKIELGGKLLTRFMKPAQAYGKAEILSIEWKPAAKEKQGTLHTTTDPKWDPSAFGANCAGCHATGVDSNAQTFSSPSLDCYTCHGTVDPKHSKDTTIVHLSRKRNDSARVIISICAQCHARGGRSKSTHLPFANNFVAGDNLFRDFRVDLTPEAVNKLDAGERHIFQNIRDVAVLGKEEVTCISCHQVHKQSTLPHRRLVKSTLCLNCHNATGSMKVRKTYEAHSQTCGY
ncbi:hypothetical protein BH10PLA2_BH10PLA2_05130 [soil metagenome]